ncbi:hypothetical protein BGW36DRAFT_293137 [Talaromyces proteolyticus]|uniref:DUF7729 domain-containing protein n=1 Tax=Talaromyces proteolyticus TaxID=1131652 RepID=A0AAD4Q2R4_9EURO|nr:uncharacterized protein BGW36DRAFT_293137 [Talaromyces proteolyticus]KAH8700657.1 hypothetical protein BGW36DRAFT_293137 [Talaromyces proteolyticus]
MAPLDILPTRVRGALVGAILHLTLILFLINSGYGSPIQNPESIESSDPSNADQFDAEADPIVARVPITPSVEDAGIATPSSTLSRRSNSFPTAFDTLGNNFTSSSCPNFFETFLNDTAYQSCHAISPLLQNSNSFFKMMSSATTLDGVLGTSCSANITSCSTFMTGLASKLINNDNCGADYQLGNPTVTQAYDSLVSYQPIATAACLKDPSTEEFCFTEAATNSSNVSNYYLYLLPLGNSLPGGSQPTCNKCTQATMQVFQESAVHKGNPLVDTYIPAAQIINVDCGPYFVNATVNVGSQASTSLANSQRRSISSSAAIACLVSFSGVLLASL